MKTISISAVHILSIVIMILVILVDVHLVVCQPLPNGSEAVPAMQSGVSGGTNFPPFRG